MKTIKCKHCGKEMVENMFVQHYYKKHNVNDKDFIFHFIEEKDFSIIEKMYNDGITTPLIAKELKVMQCVILKSLKYLELKDSISCKICGSIHKEIDFKFHHRLHKKEFMTERDCLYSYILHFFTIDEMNEIVELYNNGLTVNDIELRINKNKQKIFDVLSYFDVKLRNGKEAHVTDIYKQKLKDSIIATYGVDNISKLESIKETKIITMMKNYGRINNFCDKEIKQKALDNFIKTINDKDKRLDILNTYINTCQERYGVDNVSQISHVRQKHSEYMKNRIASFDYIENGVNSKNFWKNVKFVSKPELRVQSILNELGIEYISNCWIKGKNCDIHIKSFNLIIEIQGTYFHADPEKYKEDDIIYHTDKNNITAGNIWQKDEKKKLHLISHGYNVVYIWERETKNIEDLKKIIYILLNL